MNFWFKVFQAIPPQPFSLFPSAMDSLQPRSHSPAGRRTPLAGRGRWVLPAVLLGILLGFPGLTWSNYLQLDMVLDAKSKFSDGCSSVQELASLALSRHVDGLVVADHNRVALEYGGGPFRRIFKTKVENGSVLKKGAAAYLAEIRQVDKDSEKLLMIPAVESAPFYFWQGSPAEKNLVAHHWDKHLLILGLSHPHEYEQIPSLNSNLSTRYMHRFLWPFLLFVFLMGAGLTGFFRKK
ncbi:MAG: hypothetical protein ACE5ER_06300, partial [Nitrospinaceae bacterium]